MKITHSHYVDFESILTTFFELNSDVEPWLKMIYRLMFKKGVTSFNIDKKHIEIYFENGAINISYSTKED